MQDQKLLKNTADSFYHHISLFMEMQDVVLNTIDPPNDT